MITVIYLILIWQRSTSLLTLMLSCFFSALLIVIMYRVYDPIQRYHYEQASRIPMDDDRLEKQYRLPHDNSK